MYTKAMRNIAFYCVTGMCLTAGMASGQPNPTPTTFCNPLNLNYKALGGFREAADPAVVLYKGDYYLFASKSGGYWWSTDMRQWNFVKLNNEIPLDGSYAPAAMVYHDTLYYTVIDMPIYATTDPKDVSKWRQISNWGTGGDPCLFADDDGKVYTYWGLNYCETIRGQEIDPANAFARLGSSFSCLTCNQNAHGWERTGNNNDGGGPYIEGAWMTKHNGTYYLQYAAPGTEYRIYADGVYTSPSPRGPFTYANNSPISFRPRGFVTGAGHGSTFQDKYGNWWHAGTAYVCVRDHFERRLDIFPAGFDADGVMYANTTYGDLPITIPTGPRNHTQDQVAGWMLLSYRQPAQASSGGNTAAALDENIQTWWSAQTGNPGEWLQVDLGRECRVNAVQVNFAEEGQSISNFPSGLYQQYTLQSSLDGNTWVMMADKSANRRDVPHDYVELLQPVQARHVRITNVYTMQPGSFSIRDLRVFGSSLESRPPEATGMTVNRESDQRNATVVWNSVPGAAGYVVRYGTAPGKLYNSYQVLDTNYVSIRSLNVGVQYTFRVEAFNRTGTSDPNAVSVPTISTTGGSCAFGQVTLSCATAGAEIRYTTNGADPDATSTLYTTPFMLSGSGTVKARASKNGAQPSGIAVKDIPAPRDPENPTGTAAGLAYSYYEGTWQSGTLPDFASLTPVKNGTVAGFDISPRTRESAFAFEYTGYIDVPTEGAYTFSVTSDDGSALYIGNTKVVDNNGDHGMIEQSGRVCLKEGKHTIRVQFCQAGGGYGLEVRWEGPQIVKQIVPGSRLSHSTTATRVCRQLRELLPLVISARTPYGLKVTVNQSGPHTVRLFDQKGRAVWVAHGCGRNEYRVPVGNLTTGVYVTEVLTPTRRTIQRVGAL